MRWGPTLAGLFLSVVVPLLAATLVGAVIVWFGVP
jgi:hypothetical protein